MWFHDEAVYRMSRLDFDGLRLDAADVMDPAFLRELAAHCRARRSDIWMLGEIANGDYGAWLPRSFADNHDVTRIADQVGDLSKLPPLLALRKRRPELRLGSMEALENTHEQIWFRRVSD